MYCCVQTRLTVMRMIFEFCRNHCPASHRLLHGSPVLKTYHCEIDGIVPHCYFFLEVFADPALFRTSFSKDLLKVETPL